MAEKTNAQKLFGLLKDGNWHTHLEMRAIAGTDFRARLSAIRKQLEGTKYEILDRRGRDGHTLDHKLVSAEKATDVPQLEERQNKRPGWPDNVTFKRWKNEWRKKAREKGLR
ncbi:MAG: hypothetical protein QME66_04290 [Candidatus Eisenbacteria bacterium]|nr:hypothetical protein [Candidatus Eisenbacteria bacterium]